MKPRRKALSMTEKIIAKQQQENLGLQTSANDAIALDVFRNAMARMGADTPSVAQNTEYILERYSNNYWLMITLYRNHWIARRIVDKPAQDMCKAWPSINSDNLSPDDLGEFNRVLRKTFTQSRIQTAIKWARLFGGGGALIVIDGHEDILDEPLNLDDVTPGSYKGLIPFDRWSGITPSDEIANDINNPIDFNLPQYYQVQGEEGETFKVHSSRVLRFCGPEVPRPENQAQLHWGISELEPVFEELRKRDNASWTILNLMFRANILGQKNPELANLLSGINMSGAAAKQYMAVLEAQNQLLSNQSMLIVGKDGEMFQNSYSFAGISEVYQQFQMDIAGAARIPVSILFGRTVTGLSQSNDADIRIYEQEIAQKQVEELRPQLDKLYPIVMMSQFGEVPDDLDMNFPSIRVLTEEEKGDIAVKNVEAVLELYNSGVVGRKFVLQEIKAQSDVTGIGTNITEDMINKASDEPIEPMEIQEAEARAGTEIFSEGKAEKTNKGEGKDSISNLEKLKQSFIKFINEEEKEDEHKTNDSEPIQEYIVQGLPIVIETKAGNWREGKDFRVMMPADYGYIKHTEGADGNEMDCYVGRNIHSNQVFVIHQSKLDGKGFDEHKCMIGYNDLAEAVSDYYRGHHRAHEIFMKVEPMSMEEFKNWLLPKANDSLIDKISNWINMYRMK